MRFSIFSFVFAVLVSTAHAQSVGPPTYSVGDEWKYSDGRGLKVVKLDGDMSALDGVNRNCPTCLYYLDKNLIIQKIEQADGKLADSFAVGFVQTGWKFWDWPLEVKKTWSFSGDGMFRGNPNHYSIVCTVEAYEDVKTKAGTFKAFRIRRDWSVRDMGRGRDSSWSNTVWLAPDVKQLVKFTSTRGTDTDWELISYSLK